MVINRDLFWFTAKEHENDTVSNDTSIVYMEKVFLLQ